MLFERVGLYAALRGGSKHPHACLETDLSRLGKAPLWRTLAVFRSCQCFLNRNLVGLAVLSAVHFSLHKFLLAFIGRATAERNIATQSTHTSYQHCSTSYAWLERSEHNANANLYRRTVVLSDSTLRHIPLLCLDYNAIGTKSCEGIEFW